MSDPSEASTSPAPQAPASAPTSPATPWPSNAPAGPQEQNETMMDPNQKLQELMLAYGVTDPSQLPEDIRKEWSDTR